MATITCKMCGANLPLAEGASVVECEFCGVKQTVPTADSEKKLTLFGRANRLRFSCEFDKAAGIYESIVTEFPTEAEAYWGLVLCKYGIEYVDDPATGRKIPTCHRSSFESVMDDDNFEQVMENADPIARSVYREEAKQIEELRKGILEVSGKEEPYDIFICYKETAENGDRTLDSVIAQDVYDALTEKGYRVFFSRVTLEDKLGQEYEPYIFAALNSAKVMLVFGTDYEYYNAVWVRNEWSRFLQLIAKGEKKTLIPCYKGLDAYDIPKEFAKLQAQDMDKIGAIQDLIRGIGKLLPRKEPVKETVVVRQTSAPQSATVDSLLKRVWMYLEDGEWDNATNYCNRILDIDPENAEPYVGLLMAELRVKEEKNLGTLENDFGGNKNYAKVLRFASPDRRTVLEQYRKATVARIEEQKRIAEDKRKEAERIAENKRKEAERVAEDKRKEAERIAAKKRISLKTSRKISESASKLISCGSSHTIGIKPDRSVIATGSTIWGQCNVAGWQNIVATSGSPSHTVALKSNGTVATAGWSKNGECDIYWQDIVAISCAEGITVGLKADGTVVVKGKMLFGEYDVSGWKDIIAISCDSYQIVGLKSDGTVVATGSNDKGECNVFGWRNIVAISCGQHQTVGLKSDGTVVTTGWNYEGKCNVSGWRYIIAISCGTHHTVGLKSDGTVVATGDNKYGQCNVSGWRDIVAVSCGACHTVGLKSDGTVIAIGNNDDGRCDVSDWKLFYNLDCIDEERDRCSKDLCRHCGGEFKGLFSKKCSVCGKPKDY